MEIKDIIETYYESLAKKDDRWKELWADDAIFSDASKKLVAKGKEEIIQSFTTFLKGVESVKIKQVIIQEEHACVIVDYSYANSKGEKMQQDDAEVFMILDGKIAEMTVYFDLTAYRNFMRGN